MPNVIDLSGQTFGRLTVRGMSARRSSGHVHWSCECECGAIIDVRSVSLRDGITQSCGCLRRERAIENVLFAAAANVTHGHTAGASWPKSRTYCSWQAMLFRCGNPKCGHWKLYGGRGIRVCRRWRTSFENFLADMGERPEGMSIDRYPDNDGNYESGNCRWATPKQQRANQSVSHAYAW
ncbi:hypothetical protein LCGC14_3076500 [marine sediment metagenome]|uniref:Uncharacterized protein n=1 Tax=marine sediment metagenome TaxID=412755 RepID=A0A0F8X311_9ZZZZ